MRSITAMQSITSMRTITAIGVLLLWSALIRAQPVRQVPVNP
jgi:hypothetical protein